MYGSKAFHSGAHHWTVRIQNLKTLLGGSDGLMAVAFGVAPESTIDSHWYAYGWDTAGFSMTGDGKRHQGGFLGSDGELLINLTLTCDPIRKSAIFTGDNSTGTISIRDVPLPVRPFFLLAYQSNKICVSCSNFCGAESKPKFTKEITQKSMPSISSPYSLFAASALVALGSLLILPDQLPLSCSSAGNLPSESDLSILREMLLKEQKDASRRPKHGSAAASETDSASTNPTEVREKKSANATLMRLGFDASKHNIAFCGLTGWGKSTCINALLGEQNSEHRNCTTAAYVDHFGEGTLAMQRYPFPLDTGLVFYDLPGMGTASHPYETYWDTMQLAAFDCVLLFLDRRRLREMEAQLLQRAMRERLFVAVVYGKMDEAIEDLLVEKRGVATEGEKGLVEGLRGRLVTQLTEAVRPDAVPPVFLISGDHWMEGRRDYDEERLEKFIIRAALRKAHRDVGDEGLDRLFDSVRRLRDEEGRAAATVAAAAAPATLPARTAASNAPARSPTQAAVTASMAASPSVSVSASSPDSGRSPGGQLQGRSCAPHGAQV